MIVDDLRNAEQYACVITSANAREMQQKAANSRKLARAQADLQAAKLIVESQVNEFEQRTLARVRLQLDKVYDAFMAECRRRKPDAAKLDRLAAAQARLSEQERILSGRPMPGSLKPTQPRRPKSAESPSGNDPLPADS